jgi:exportin-1
MSEELEEVNPEQLNIAANALSGQDQSMTSEEANVILCNFRVRPDAYLYTKDIVESEANIYLKNTAFQALTLCVDTRWKCIEPEPQQQIKQFLVEYILGNEDPENKIIIAATRSLIAVLNQDYPFNWPNFINEILDISYGEPLKLANCFDFLTAFFESVSKSAREGRTLSRANNMESNIKMNGIKRIMELLREILTSSECDSRLIRSSLSLLAISVKWTYPFALFQSDIFTTLSTQFLTNPQLALDTVPVLAEIAQNIQFPDQESHCIVVLFNLIMNALNGVVEQGGELTVKVLSDFIAALTTYFDHYGYIIDHPTNHDQFCEALRFAWSITETAEDVLFDLCIEFWYPICNRIALQVKTGEIREGYLQYAPSLRRLLIEKMVTPYEIAENMDIFGNVSRRLISSDSESEYKNMRKCLAILTQIDPEDTQKALSDRYGEILGGDFNAKAADSLCWAIAATAGTFPEEIENELIPDILNTFIEIVSKSENGEEIDVYARGIAYICAQYFTPLIKNEELFINYALTLINYIGNSKDMELLQYVALDTLRFFSSNRLCRPLLVKQVEGNPSVFQYILENFRELFDALTVGGGITFVTIICNITSVVPEGKQEKVKAIIDAIDEKWVECTSSPDPTNLAQNLAIFNTVNYITRIPAAQPEIFAEYLSEHIPQYIELLTLFGGAANELIAGGGSQEILQSIKAVIDAIIGIVYKYASFAQPNDILPTITDDFVKALMEQFSQSEPDARVPQTLNFFSILMIKLEENIQSMLPDILSSVYGPSLEMIRDDFDAFPEFRPEIFQMMDNIISHCRFYISSLTVEQLIEFTECLKWGCQHPQPEISTYCFKILKDLIDTLMSIQNPDLAQAFEANIFPDVLIFAFHMLSDVTYRFAFKQEAELIFLLIKNELFGTHLQRINEAVVSFFDDQDPSVIASLFSRLISCNSIENAKNILLDFLVLVREISPYDPQLKRAEADARLKSIENNLDHVPGFVSPFQIAETQVRVDPEIEKFLNHVNEMNFKK